MSTFTGTLPLIRFTLRRDRVRLPIWLAALLVLVYASAEAVRGLYPNQATLDLYDATMSSSAAAIAMNGPPTALDTLGGVIVYEVNLTVMIAVALMGVFLVVRHTRGEEEAGRTELVRSGVVGRHAPTTAALLVVGAGVVAVGAGISAIMLAVGLPTSGSLGYGASIALLGLLFTAIGACAAQATAHARGAIGISAGLLGVAFLLRAIGDVGNQAFSWLSPLGWAQALRPFGDERWWPLALLIAATVAMFVLAAVLTTHRDLGSGLVAARAGRATARPRLGTAVGLAARLQRGALIGWTTGVFIGGVAFGSLSREVAAMIELNPAFAQTLASMGTDLVDAFLATMLLVLAIATGGFTISSTLRLRSEETAGRIEPLLATGLSRRRWMAGGLAVTAAGTALVLAAGGLGAGIAYAVVEGEPGQIVRLTLSALVYAPAALLLAGVAALLFGLVPRATAAAWAALAYCFVVGWLGTVLNFPAVMEELTPYTHIPQVPAEDLRAAPLVLVTLITVALLTAGVANFARRDIAS